MDLAELGVVAKQTGVSETTDALDKLSSSAGNADQAVAGFNSKSGATKTATDEMNSSVDAGVGSFGALGGAILGAVAALAAMAAATVSLQKFVDATSEAEAMQAQLAAALQSTRGASGQTIESLNAQAAALQATTNYGDEAVNSAQALLLTFTKISGDVFPKATEAVADLSARMGGDLSGAALQVGKALNDPVQGITALSRAGIQFTEDQKSMIRSFVDANNIIGAQTVILKELETQFGGSAEAARATLGGAITSLQNSFGDLFEVSGPATDNLRAAIEKLIKSISDPAFKDFANTVGSVMFTALELAVKGFVLLSDGIGAFWAYAGPTIKTFGTVMYELGAIIIPAVGDAFVAIWEIVKPIIQYFLEGWKEVYNVVASIIGLQDQVEVPQATATAAANDNTVPSPSAVNDASKKLNAALTTGGDDAAKSMTTAGKTVADTAAQAHEVGAKTLANSFGQGADAIGTATADGGDIIGKAIEANGATMAAKFEGTGRNIYDLWNNWGDSFIDSFGTSIGELLIDFQQAQTEQLEAQAELLRAQADLTREQYERLRDTPMTGQNGSGGSNNGGGNNGGGSESSFGFGGNGLGGDNDNGRRNRRRGGGGDLFNIGSDAGVDNGPTTTKGRNRFQPLDERGNISLTINNKSDPKDTLDNLNTSTGGRVVISVLSTHRHAAKRLLGIRG